jgi:hypothetical protein
VRFPNQGDAFHARVPHFVQSTPIVVAVDL